jgi:hypothetical protein
MEQSPSLEANRSAASQESPRILWKRKVYYRIYKHPSPVPSMSRINPLHASPSHFLQIHFNIILQVPYIKYLQMYIKGYWAGLA